LNVPPQQSDRQLLEFLASIRRPFLMVGTKADKLSGNSLRNSLEHFRQAVPGLRIVPYSARTGSGRDELWREIRNATQASQPESPEVAV
jgi:GTP-binding protein